MNGKATAKETKKWIWAVDLDPIVGSTVRFETRDGVRREGRASDLRYSELRIDGRTVRFPTEIELNGDPGDLVDIARLVWLETS